MSDWAFNPYCQAWAWDLGGLIESCIWPDGWSTDLWSIPDAPQYLRLIRSMPGLK